MAAQMKRPGIVCAITTSQTGGQHLLAGNGLIASPIQGVHSAAEIACKHIAGFTDQAELLTVAQTDGFGIVFRGIIAQRYTGQLVF